MRDERDRPGLARGAAEQGARLERGAVGGEFEQAGVAARADDLEEAEAIDRGALERCRQDVVDRLGDRLPRGLAADRGQVDPDRSGDAVAADRPRGGGGAGERELLGRQVAIDVDQGHRRGQRHAQLAAGKGDDPAARFVEQVGPAGRLKRVGRRRKGQGQARRSRARRRGRRRVTRASGRFHGSAPASASRVTSIVSAAPSVTPGAPLGSRYSCIARPRDRQPSRLDQPRGEDRPGGDDAVAQDPRLDDRIVLDQHDAGFPDAALDPLLRQGGSPRS